MLIMYHWKKEQCCKVHYEVQSSEVHCTVQCGAVEWGASDVKCIALHRAVKCSEV